LNKVDLELDDVFGQNDDISLRKLSTEFCLFSPSKGIIMTLNETAIDIWNSFDGNKSLFQILSKIKEKYSDVDPHKLHDDLFNTASIMIYNGFLKKV
jgi:hypothetical protein